MTNAINIGKLIYGTLINNEQISSLVGIKVFPLIAENETTFPFITYSRLNVANSLETKDAFVIDEVQFNIQVADNNYERSCEIANLVRGAFENKIISNNELQIKRIRMTNISELYNEDTYVQSITFSCTAE